MIPYEMLNNGGPESPGETSRTMSQAYIKLKSLFQTKASVNKEIIEERAATYRNVMKDDILNSSLITRALKMSNGELPFLIYVDIIAKMHNQGGLSSVLENMEVLTQVIVDNHNKLLPAQAISDVTSLKERVTEFINNEY